LMESYLTKTLKILNQVQEVQNQCPRFLQRTQTVASEFKADFKPGFVFLIT